MNLLNIYKAELNEKCKLGDVEWLCFTGFTSSLESVREKDSCI